MDKPHTNGIDSIKLLISLYVVVWHMLVISQTEAFPLLRQGMSKGIVPMVALFFVFSGWLVMQSWYKSSNWKVFYRKRTRRLLPEYVLLIIVCAVACSLMSSLPAGEYFFSHDWWAYLGANLTFLNFLHPCLPGVFENDYVNDASINPALWTMKIEVGFYLIVPLLAWMADRSRRKWVLLVVLYIVSLIWYNSFIHSSLPCGGTMSHQLPGHMCSFVTGMGMYYYKDWFLLHKNKLIVPALVICGIEYWFDGYILSPLCWGIAALWLACSWQIISRLPKWLNISYGVYIYHSPILKVMLSLGLFAFWPLWQAIGLFIGLVFGVSILSWWGIEQRIKPIR